jgi:hypothetical protein
LSAPSARSLSRLQSPQNACVMLVTKLTLPLKPGTVKFLATSPAGSCRRCRPSGKLHREVHQGQAAHRPK